MASSERGVWAVKGGGGMNIWNTVMMVYDLQSIITLTLSVNKMR